LIRPKPPGRSLRWALPPLLQPELWRQPVPLQQPGLWWMLLPEP
jgi:hypothetical protein